MNIFDLDIPEGLSEEAYNHLWDNAFDEDGELTEDPEDDDFNPNNYFEWAERQSAVLVTSWKPGQK